MKTHFEVFGLPARYVLDAGALEKKYRELSLKLHPDRVMTQASKEKRQAVEATADLNEAYRILKDPIRRAFYLLKLQGVDLDREDTGAQKDMPLEFLEEVIALREELDEAKQAKNLGKAQEMAKHVNGLRQGALTQAIQSLEKLEMDSGEAVALRQAAYELARVRYFTRFLEEVDALGEEVL